MKKAYTKPNMEVVSFVSETIVTTSGPLTTESLQTTFTTLHY